jgi:hypothetical protein
MNQRQRICTPFSAYEMQHMRHLPDADFALIRKPPEHNRGLAAAPIAIGKREAKMTMPTPMS